jgi:hypothetical protein
VVGAVGVLSLVAWALICAGQLAAVALSILASDRSVFAVPGLASNVVENALCGGLGGFAVGAAAWRAKGRRRFGALFWGEALSVALTGLLAAAFAGVVGALGLPPGVATSARALFSAGEVPIMVFLSGGMQGPGGAEILELAFLYVVVLLLVAVIAVQVAIAQHLAYWVVARRSKGPLAAFFGDLVRTRPAALGQPAEALQPVSVGLERGLALGLLLGLAEALFTTWGAALLA